MSHARAEKCRRTQTSAQIHRDREGTRQPTHTQLQSQKACAGETGVMEGAVRRIGKGFYSKGSEWGVDVLLIRAPAPTTMQSHTPLRWARRRRRNNAWVRRRGRQGGRETDRRRC